MRSFSPQGCEARATLGKAKDHVPILKGLNRKWRVFKFRKSFVFICGVTRLRTTTSCLRMTLQLLFRVEPRWDRRPWVAPRRNPGLNDLHPFRITATHRASVLWELFLTEVKESCRAPPCRLRPQLLCSHRGAPVGCAEYENTCRRRRALRFRGNASSG